MKNKGQNKFIKDIRIDLIHLIDLIFKEPRSLVELFIALIWLCFHPYIESFFKQRQLNILLTCISFIFLSILIRFLTRAAINIFTIANEIFLLYKIAKVSKKNINNTNAEFSSYLYKITYIYFKQEIKIEYIRRNTITANLQKTLVYNISLIITAYYLLNIDFIYISTLLNEIPNSILKNIDIFGFAKDLIPVITLIMILAALFVPTDKFLAKRDIRRENYKDLYNTSWESSRLICALPKDKYVRSILQLFHLRLGNIDILHQMIVLNKCYENFKEGVFKWEDFIYKNIIVYENIKNIFVRDLFNFGISIDFINWVKGCEPDINNSQKNVSERPIRKFSFGAIQDGLIDLDYYRIMEIVKDNNEYNARYTIYQYIFNIQYLHLCMAYTSDKLNPYHRSILSKIVNKILDVKQ